MLNLSSPFALWLGLAVIPIIFFYFLRMRFQKQPVSSIYLWSRLQRSIHGAGRLRSRTVFILLLQLLAAIAAVLAVAQPVWKFNDLTLTTPGIIYLIDVSASMGATDVMKQGRFHNRLEEAIAILTAEIHRQPRRTEGMIFLCSAGIVPLGNPTRNRDQLISRLQTVRDGNAGFDETEVTEALKAWLLTRRKTWRAVLVTDGGLDLNGKKLQDLFQGYLKIMMVGFNGNNLGVTALRLLPGGEASFQIVNGWSYDQSTKVVLEYNQQIIARADIQAPSGVSNQTLLFSSPVRTGVYRIRLEQPPGALTLGNQYYLAINRPQPVRVLLIGSHNPFLQAIFNNPVVELVPPQGLTAFPKDINGTDWDLIVADQVPIPPNLRCNILAFGVAPPTKPDLIGKPVNGELHNVSTIHPLLRFTDWSKVQVTGGNSLMARSDVQVLATVNGHPIIAAWEEAGWHYVVFGADFYHSDLGLSESFPIFIQNLLQWCVPQANNQLAYTLTVGEARTFAEPSTWRVIDAGDDVRISVLQGRFFTLNPLAPGVFHWKESGSQGVLAVNLPPGELDITPRPLNFPKEAPLLTAQRSYFPKTLPGGKEESGSFFSFQSWTLGLFLVCLCAEWILWRGLPGRKE